MTTNKAGEVTLPIHLITKNKGSELFLCSFSPSDVDGDGKLQNTIFALKKGGIMRCAVTDEIIENKPNFKITSSGFSDFMLLPLIVEGGYSRSAFKNISVVDNTGVEHTGTLLIFQSTRFNNAPNFNVLLLNE